MKKTKFNLFVLTSTMILAANAAGAASIYDNNISALNINMLTDTFMSYVAYGEHISDLFDDTPNIYGTMSRAGEYGDDGSTLKTIEETKANVKPDMFIRNTWANANHININAHYGNGTSEHGRFNLATVGGTTKSISLHYGNIAFGGFASYINTKIADAKSGGDVVGLFSHYKYRNFGARTLTNVGSINNRVENIDFNNSWVNVATDAYANLRIDDSFFVRPSVYIGYTWISSDDLYINNSTITTSDYNFINIAPGVQFIKEISKDWYGTLSGKYVAHFGGDNHIYADGVVFDSLEIDNHTDLGIDIEHDWKHFIITGKVHKLLGGIDGWDSNINIKYVF